MMVSFGYVFCIYGLVYEYYNLMDIKDWKKREADFVTKIEAFFKVS